MMGVIEQQKIEIEMQFISIAESISIIADCEKTDTNSVILWFKDQEDLIRKQLMLKKESVLSLVEFKPVDDSTGEYYESPACFLIKYLKIGFVYDDLKKLLSVKNVGFARKRFLHSLLNLGVDIKEDYLHNAISYIPHGNNEYEAHSINTYKYLTEHISDLAQENTELNKKISTNQPTETKQANCNCETLESENTKLKQRIAELEQQLKQSQQVPNKPNDIDLLAHILDSTKKHHAPDLALSIQLYKHVYIDNPNQDSHTNRANLWLSKNTNYNADRQSGSRIREITAPLNGWNPQRDKKFLKS